MPRSVNASAATASASAKVGLKNSGGRSQGSKAGSQNEVTELTVLKRKHNGVLLFKSLIFKRTRKHAVPALTSEATLCRNLKRKFGEHSAQRTRKHTVPALTSEATLCRNLKRKFGERIAKRTRKHTIPALTSEVTLRRNLKRKFGERSALRAVTFLSPQPCQA